MTGRWTRSERYLLAKLGLHPESRDTCEDEAAHTQRLTQQAQQGALAERAAALAFEASS